MSSPKDNWIAVTRSEPCPICGKPDNCKIALDGGAVFCGRVESDRPPNAGGQYLHSLSNSSGYSHPVLSDAPPPKSTPNATSTSVKARDWGKDANFCSSLAKDCLNDLAIQLGVDVGALRRLTVGRVKDSRKDFWTFPERDANGNVIGINKRYHESGKKICFKGSKRGLTYSNDWYETPGPIFLVEGASDTAALMTLGFCAIGRPSNSGGIDHLIDLLKHHPNREIIVLGEYDEKENGAWPGRDGALSTAKSLSAGLGRPIDWTFPPAGSKDVRAYLTSKGPKPPWELDLQTIEPPPPPPPPEPYKPPIGPERNLNDWREDLIVARLEALKEPRLYFDGSPTGAGKSFADRTAMEKAGLSLSLVPTHDNGDELVHELKEAGLDAAKLPARASPEAVSTYESSQAKKRSKYPWNYGICLNTPEVKKAESYGLSAGAAVCPSCKYRDGCDYLAERGIAMKANHLVATRHMFAHNSESLSQDRKYIAVHEDTEDMIRPLLQLSAEELAWLSKVGAEGKFQQTERLLKSVQIGIVELFDQIADESLRVIKIVEQTTQSSVFPEKPLQSTPSNQQQRILVACESLREREKLTDSEISSKAMKFILGLIFGKITQWAVVVEKSQNPHRTKDTLKSIVAVGYTVFPTDATIVFSDATGRPENIEDLTGRPVRDIIPSGYLKRRSPICQIPIDIKRSTGKSTVVKLLAAVMLRHPEAKKIGVIGHKPHIDGLEKADSDLGSLKSRIHKTAYFGGGSDRASNDWHSQCDLLVVLGTPRVRPSAITNRLIRLGKLESLAQDGGWGPRKWEAETVSGGRRVIEGLGYEHPDWRLASEDQVKAAVLQAAGRGRSYQKGGIPVLVFSNEPLGLPVEDLEGGTESLSSRGLELFSWIESQIAKSLYNIYYSFGNFKTGEVAAAMGVSNDRISKAIKELANIGYLTKLGHGKWGVTHLPVPQQEVNSVVETEFEEQVATRS